MNLGFLDTVSTYAGDIDGLIILVGVLVGVWGGLAMGMFFWLCWRFRAQSGVRALYVTGYEKDLNRWISIPHALILVCDVFIVAGSVRVWYLVKQDLPPADSTIRVTAQQWAWIFRHPGADNQLDTPDDLVTVDELHVEAGKTYHYQLESRDVLHDFSVPVFRLKQDAIPGRVITGWFKATKGGTYDIQCAEMCGIGHGLMPAKIHIDEPAAHAAWISDHTPSLAQLIPAADSSIAIP